MVMLDANVILRYLLNDHEEMASEAETVIKSTQHWLRLRFLQKSSMC